MRFINKSIETTGCYGNQQSPCYIHTFAFIIPIEISLTEITSVICFQEDLLISKAHTVMVDEEESIIHFLNKDIKSK